MSDQSSPPIPLRMSLPGSPNPNAFRLQSTNQIFSITPNVNSLHSVRFQISTPDQSNPYQFGLLRELINHRLFKTSIFRLTHLKLIIVRFVQM
ncbi:hypothetical protein PTTG_25913 [Puccinia triticina 1-1 BBBD Race 1]|uniref:Uncharacterized protein n=1 Tax=Puccinia triticina (isolate 1-1 / race 1 (BBBD)) TaxID=630390 RepID=A0A180GZ74_PUCT1|nr:hypothetical protein PTTG_25913 [Puccinia triticina 1-1 BBBD Race 1]